jgi:pimeloyl-ACP methyl ester carboxylesterase
MQNMLTNRTLIILAGVFFLAGCTSLAEEFARKADALKLKREVVTGSRFQHVIYIKTGPLSKTLHIYLDGDGILWIAGRPSDDPTPRNPMVLNLMALDRAPAIYVGRPCYHGVKATGACSSHFWLKDRYSEEVVASLSTVIKQLIEHGGYGNVAWFGHSGGGALAVLLASRFPQTTSVVTLAANLDLDAWAAYTGHSDLSGSLNPASLPPLPGSVSQRHYAGGKDRIVPPALMAKAAAHLGSELIVLDDYDHICCWERIWRTVLDELAE